MQYDMILYDAICTGAPRGTRTRPHPVGRLHEGR